MRLEKCTRTQIVYLSARNAPQDEGYPAGVNAMFYKLFDMPDMQRYDYIFWFLKSCAFNPLLTLWRFEPDVTPVQPLWLDSLYNTVLNNPHLMMMGSGYKPTEAWIANSIFEECPYQKNSSICVELKNIWSWIRHINGNALYALNPEMTTLIWQARTFTDIPIKIKG